MTSEELDNGRRRGRGCRAGSDEQYKKCIKALFETTSQYAHLSLNHKDTVAALLSKDKKIQQLQRRIASLETKLKTRPEANYSQCGNPNTNSPYGPCSLCHSSQGLISQIHSLVARLSSGDKPPAAFQTKASIQDAQVGKLALFKTSKSILDSQTASFQTTHSATGCIHVSSPSSSHVSFPGTSFALSLSTAIERIERDHQLPDDISRLTSNLKLIVQELMSLHNHDVLALKVINKTCSFHPTNINCLISARAALGKRFDELKAIVIKASPLLDLFPDIGLLIELVTNSQAAVSDELRRALSAVDHP